MIAPQEKLSQVSSDDGQSPRGLINKEEAVKSLKAGAIAGGLISAGFVVLTTMLGDFDKWYTGPFKEVLAGIVAVGAMYLRAYCVSQSLADEGDTHK